LYLKLVHLDAWPPHRRRTFESAARDAVGMASDNGLTLVGAWSPLVGPVHEIVELWAADDADAMTAAEARLAADPGWQGYREAIRDHVGERRVRYLTPAPISPDVEAGFVYPTEAGGVWLYAHIDLLEDKVERFYELMWPTMQTAEAKGRPLVGSYHPVGNPRRVIDFWRYPDVTEYATASRALRASDYDELRTVIQDETIVQARLSLLAPVSYSPAATSTWTPW
jgi:hypothetical protein